MARSKGPALPLVDLDSPQKRRLAARNVVNVFHTAPPETVQAGREWYDRVNEAVSKGVKGTSTSVRQGAGLVAAVSPNMDWENHNIAAFGELHSLRSQQWKQIIGGDRSPLAGMSVSRATDDGLLKAHRILEGEDPDTVMPRRTAPKTNSFFHNIAEPDVAGPVTIDGRAHDIAANRLQGWEQGRGIGSADLKTGKSTRYEHFENAYRTAADALNQEGHNVLPHQVQAVTWEQGKRIERSVPTKSGKPRQKGVTRTGQRYVGPGGLA